MRDIKPIILGWKPKPGSGWQVAIHLFKLNAFIILLQMWLAAFATVLSYTPASSLVYEADTPISFAFVCLTVDHTFSALAAS